MRIWTYLVFAETRLEISQHPLSQADVEWFKQNPRYRFPGSEVDNLGMWAGRACSYPLN
jgi:hypothetical protein